MLNVFLKTLTTTVYKNGEVADKEAVGACGAGKVCVIPVVG